MDYRDILQKLIGDNPDPNDTQGIVPATSPIDFVAGGLGAKLGDAAGSAAADAFSQRAAQAATDNINAQAMARSAALGRYLNPEIQALKEAAPGEGTLSGQTQQVLNTIGNNAPETSPKVSTVANYLQDNQGTKPVDLNAYRESAPTQTMTSPGEADTDNDNLAKILALKKLRGQ